MADAAERAAALDGAELLTAAAGGCAACCRELVSRFRPKMLAATRRLLGDAHAAEDSVQEAFLSAIRKADSFRGDSNLGAWLTRIALNHAYSSLRSAPARRTMSIEDLQPSFDDDSGVYEGPPDLDQIAADELIAKDQARAKLREAIDALPPDYRAAIMLRDIEECSTRDAAEILGITEAAMKVRLHRARNAVRKLIEPMLERRA